MEAQLIRKWHTFLVVSYLNLIPALPEDYRLRWYTNGGVAKIHQMFIVAGILAG